MASACHGIVRKLKALNMSIKKLVGTENLDEDNVQKLVDKTTTFDDQMKEVKSKLAQMAKIKF